MRVVMGRMSTAAALLAAASLAFPLAASAQSLGEAAERAKKERKGKTTKVITEADLPRTGSYVPVSSAETTEAADGKETPKEGTAAAATKPAEKTEDELRAEAEGKWRERVKKAQGDVARFTQEADAIQFALNDHSTNPYGNNRVSLLNRIEEVKKDLATAKQAVADLEEEGRRSRFRP